MEEEKLIYFLYFLAHPLTKEIQYIGCTKDPRNRYAQHIITIRGNTPKEKWLKKLSEKNLKPIMGVFYSVDSAILSIRFENAAIEYCKSKNIRLLNNTLPHDEIEIEDFNLMGIAFEKELKYFLNSENYEDVFLKTPFISRKIQVILTDAELELFKNQAKRQGRSESNLGRKYLMEGLSKDEQTEVKK